jgi:hypothetical protein
MAVRQRIGGVNAAAGKDVGTGRKAGRGRAARHQHLDTGLAIAEQQHGGGSAQGGRLTLRIEKLGRSDHGRILPADELGTFRHIQPEVSRDTLLFLF